MLHLVKAGYQIGECGLATAWFSNQRDRFTRLYHEADITQCILFSIVVMKADSTKLDPATRAAQFPAARVIFYLGIQ